jgi:hypothetical protein
VILFVSKGSFSIRLPRDEQSLVGKKLHTFFFFFVENYSYPRIRVIKEAQIFFGREADPIYPGEPRN